MKPYRILEGDVLDQLATLPDASVHCCVTSPPYWALRDYGILGQIGMEKTPAEYIAKIVAVFREVRRVLRNDGTCWINMGDSYAGGGRGGNSEAITGIGKDASRIGVLPAPSPFKAKDICGMPWRVAFALQDDGWYLRQDIIWSKPNPMPESVGDRCTKAHEYLFLLSKCPRYYFDQEAIKERCSSNTHARKSKVESANSRLHKDRDPAHSSARKVKVPGGWDVSKGQGGHGTLHRENRTVGEYRDPGVGPKASPAGSGVRYNESFSAAVTDVLELRNKRSVWEIPTEAFEGAHFATFPTGLVRPCILAGCPEGGVVLDPFSGSGTTGVVALRHHREYIGIELNPEWVAMSHARIQADAPLFNSSRWIPEEGHRMIYIGGFSGGVDSQAVTAMKPESCSSKYGLCE